MEGYCTIIFTPCNSYAPDLLLVFKICLGVGSPTVVVLETNRLLWKLIRSGYMLRCVIKTRGVPGIKCRKAFLLQSSITTPFPEAMLLAALEVSACVLPDHAQHW